MHYSVKDIAKILSVNPETVRRWVRDGKIKAEPIGTNRKKGFKITKEELKNFLDSEAKYGCRAAAAIVTQEEHDQKVEEYKKKMQKITKLVAEINKLLEDL